MLTRIPRLQECNTKLAYFMLAKTLYEQRFIYRERRYTKEESRTNFSFLMSDFASTIRNDPA